MRKSEDLLEHYEMDVEKVEKLQIEEALLTEREMKEWDEIAQQRVLNRTLEKLQMDSKDGAQKQNFPLGKGKRIKGKRFVVLVAVCTLVFTMGMVSFATNFLDGDFKGFLGVNNEKKEELLNQMGMVIDQKIEQNGYTIHMREAISDSNSTYLLFDVIAPEGTSLDLPQYCFLQQRVMLDGPASGAGYYFEQLEDEDEEDNQITMMLCYSTEKDLTGQKLLLEFQDLGTYKDLIDVPQEQIIDDCYVKLAEGTWNFEFTLEHTNATIERTVSKNIKISDKEYKIQKMSLSPISILFTLSDTGDCPRSDDCGGLRIRLKDGTYVGIASRSSSNRGTKATMIYKFDRAIDPAEIGLITYYGEKIPF